MDPSKYKVAQLKELLQKKQMSTQGTKIELLARLQEADPEGDWMQDIESGEASGLQPSVTEYEVSHTTRPQENRDDAGPEVSDVQRELEYMRRERALMEREMRLLERENRMLRGSSVSREGTIPGTEMPARVNIKAVSELLSEFNGSEGVFRNWEKQAKLLIATYQLDDKSAKIMLGMRLKDKALEWFPSCPVHIELSVEELLSKMRKMYDHKESKLKLRKQFEERVWKSEETFSSYYHEKIIMANRVPIEEEEIVEYLVDGISNMQLRNQAKLQNFGSKFDLLTAFETIRLEEVKSQSAREMKGQNKEQKEIRAFSKIAVTKEATKELPMKKARCYNCSKTGHISKDCRLPKREKGACFKCGEKGHTISECKNKVESEQVANVSTKFDDEDFQEIVILKRNDTVGNFEIKVDALFDTGSPITFIKEKFIPKCFSKTNNLNSYCGINNSKLEMVGTITLDVMCDRLNAVGVQIYVVDNNTMSASMIIGRDLIKKFNVNLTIVNKSERVEEELEILNINVGENDNISERLNINSEIAYEEKTKLVEMFEKEYVQPERPIEPKVNAELTLRLFKVQPFHFSPRRLSYMEKDCLRKLVDELLAKGIIKESDSEYASPVILVPKKNGEFRLCIDYRTLNKYIAKDNYPIPVIEDQINVLKNKRYFSILDLKDGFYHIRMAEESMPYTAFVTPFGQFEFTKMPFGLKSAPTRFQKFVNEIVDSLIRSGDALVYIDDFLIATETIEHHLNILRQVFWLMVDNKLMLRVDKCKFLFTKIEYLGYSITSKGISPTDDGIKAIIEFPVPQSVRNVQSFLGMCSYFRKFIEGFSVIAKPLYDLLKKDAIFKFTDIELNYFEKLKSKLIIAPVLAIYDPQDLTELHCDASSHGFGAVLVQRKRDHKLHPIFYFSKRTTPSESKFHSFELEALAIIYALRRFRVYLFGIPFKILTDCNALKLTFQKKDINPRISRWAMELQSFDYTVEHRPGDRMKHVDALSRSFSICIVEDNPFEYNLSVCQSQDEKIKELCKELEQNESPLFEMRNGLIYRKRKDHLLFYVPRNMEKNVLFRYHDLMGHLGSDKTMEVISRNYWFPNLKFKIKEHIANCLKCVAYSPPSGKVEGKLHAIPKGNIPLDILHIDHLGPIDKECMVKKYVFLVVDAFSKFVRLYATKTTASKETIKALQDYFVSYSKPRIIISDRGSCFTSQEFKNFMDEQSVKHILIATGSPQSNGQVERVNRVLIPLLSKLVDKSEGQQWYKILHEAEYALNNSVSKATGETPCRLLLGIDQRGKHSDEIKEYLQANVNENKVDLKQIREKSAEKIVAFQKYNKSYFDKKHKCAIQYKEGDYVMLRNFDVTVGASKKLIPRYKGPYMIVKPLRNDRYLVSDVPGFQNTQRKYQGVWEPKNMKPWIRGDPEISDKIEDDL